MELQKVDFSGGNEGITALYVDGKLYKYGDYYHNKIEFIIDGFIEGLQYILGDDVTIKDIIYLDEYHPLVYSTWELADSPPNLLSDINEDDRREPNEND